MMTNMCDESCKIDNSFYHQSCRGKVLVIVPHEDDETIVAGNLIYNLTSAGAEVYVLYTTNGDWNVSADVRSEEAAEALALLGVPRTHIWSLGYGDSLNNDEKNSIFYHEEGRTRSAAGHTETYAGSRFGDFAYERRGEHSGYNSTCFRQDLRDAIELIRPKLLICVDYDEHPDHRLLSLFFDRTVYSILQDHPDYRPQILKRFAYALAYTAKADLFSLNNPSTQRPNVTETGRYLFDFIDKSVYSWESRVRLPAAVPSTERSLRKNLIAGALACHRSQYATAFADRIINADEIYWERRTDNLAVCSDVEVSSGNADCLTDGLLYYTSDIDHVIPTFDRGCWRPDTGDHERRLSLKWENEISATKLVIYGRMNSEGQIERLLVEVGADFRLEAGPVNRDGSPLEVRFKNAIETSRIDIRILDADGQDYGIAEVEVYDDGKDSCRYIQPFLKITVDDDFVYDYYVPDDKEYVDLGFYCYEGIMKDSIRLKVIEGDGVTINRRRVLFNGRNYAVIRADAETIDGNQVFDQIILRRVSSAFRKRLEAGQKVDLMRIRMAAGARRLNIWKRYLSEHGLSYTASRVIRKLTGRGKR